MSNTLYTLRLTNEGEYVQFILEDAEGGIILTASVKSDRLHRELFAKYLYEFMEALYG